MSRNVPSATGEVQSLRRYLRQSIVTGTAIVLPLLLTVVVLFVGLNFLAGLLDPLVIPIHQLLGGAGDPGLLALALAATVLATLIVTVGILAESKQVGDIERHIDAAVGHVPGISTIHGTLEQLSDILVESDTDNFQEVVLVEYPGEGSYSVAFKTSEPPDVVVDATDGENMITVFMPMGPNPVMGGFVLHISEERVHDVDLSVEQGITSIVSFGVAIDQEEGPAATDSHEEPTPEPDAGKR